MALFKKKDLGNDPKVVWEEFFKVVMKNEWKNALEIINKLKELEPDNPQVSMKIGDILQRTGDNSGASSAYREAAEGLVDAGESTKALAIYKIVLRLNPGDEEALARTEEIMSYFDSPETATYEEVAGEEGVQQKVYQEEAQESEPIEEAQPEPEPEPERAAEPEPEPEPEPVPATESATESAQPIQAAQIPEAILNAFSKHPLFSVLNSDDVTYLLQSAQHKSFADKDIIIKEEEPGDSMFLIKKGKVVVTAMFLNKNFGLARLTGGGFFGEGGFLTGRVRSATVTAEGPADVMEISKELMQQIVEKNPAVLNKLVEFSHSRAQKTMDKIKGS